MAVNITCKIADRPGPSTFEKDAIDVLSVSFGVALVGSSQEGSSGTEMRTGRASFQDISVNMVCDKLTPALFDDCATGNILDTVVLTYHKAMGDVQVPYIKIRLEKAMITNFSISSGGEHPDQAVTFAYQKVKLSYDPEVDGKLIGFIDKGYDLSTATFW